MNGQVTQIKYIVSQTKSTATEKTENKNIIVQYSNIKDYVKVGIILK